MTTPKRRTTRKRSDCGTPKERLRIEPLNGVSASFSINVPIRHLIEVLPCQQLTAVLRGLAEVMNAAKEPRP